MDKSREIVLALAQRAIVARRALIEYDKSGLATENSELRFAYYCQFNEARNCYRVARMILSEVEF
jgi:hypothetical protein